MGVHGYQQNSSSEFSLRIHEIYFESQESAFTFNLGDLHWTDHFPRRDGAVKRLSRNRDVFASGK